MQIRQLLFVFLATGIYATTAAQKVGIGTNSPLRKLAVTGSIMVDQNSNNTGTLDSAALVFGNAGHAGISSRQNGLDPQSLTFWTNNMAHMYLSNQGSLGIGGSSSTSHRLRVVGNAVVEGNLNAFSNIFAQGHMGTQNNMGIGGAYDLEYRLRVYNGNSRFGGDLYATGSGAFGGPVDSDYRLKVVGGNSIFDGDLRATGSMSVGGNVDNEFRFRVWGGNSRFGGNVEITGNVTTANVDISNSLTIGGNGSVRSNGPSSLRVGFDEKNINVVIPANEAVSVAANITDFSGDNDDVRVFVSQFVPGGVGSLFWPNIIVSISHVNATNNTCLIWLHNRSSAQGTLTGTLYLTTIAKN